MSIVPLPRPDTWPELWSSFERSLRAEGVSANTLRMYREAGDQAHVFLIAEGYSTDPAMVTKAQVEESLNSLLDAGKGLVVRQRGG